VNKTSLPGASTGLGPAGPPGDSRPQDGPSGGAAPQHTHRILVVEDDPHLAAGVVENLRAEGYEVAAVASGRLALEWLEANSCGLVLLDVMLPEIDGFTVCRTLRERKDNTPVLFLTARGDPADRVRGLEVGGDDYLAKPFHLRELLLRVKAILRRWDWYQSASAADGAVLRFGGNEVDFRAFRARSWNGSAQELTEKEAMILKVLAERPGEIVSREDLLERVWGYDVFPSTRTVDNFILRLRKRFERDPADPRHFLTVWGVGYRFIAGGEP
jgi:two-component system alkaline phosphatase synthesis response regulator PhoP